MPPSQESLSGLREEAAGESARLRKQTEDLRAELSRVKR